jgi:hypothetical protein
MELNGEIKKLKEELEKEKALIATEPEKEIIPADTTNNEVQ